MTTMDQEDGAAYLASFGASPEEIKAYYAEDRTDRDFLTAVFALMTLKFRQNTMSPERRGE